MLVEITKSCPHCNAKLVKEPQNIYRCVICHREYKDVPKMINGCIEWE